MEPPLSALCVTLARLCYSTAVIAPSRRYTPGEERVTRTQSVIRLKAFMAHRRRNVNVELTVVQRHISK